MKGTQSLQFWSILGPNLPPENKNIEPKLYYKLYPIDYQITQVSVAT